MTNGQSGEIIHRNLDTDAGNPAIEVVGAVADIEGRNATELTAVHDCIDGILDELFSNPPAPESQAVVEFSYEAYRITVEQNGRATFVKTE